MEKANFQCRISNQCTASFESANSLRPSQKVLKVLIAVLCLFCGYSSAIAQNYIVKYAASTEGAKASTAEAIFGISAKSVVPLRQPAFGLCTVSLEYSSKESQIPKDVEAFDAMLELRDGKDRLVFSSFLRLQLKQRVEFLNATGVRFTIEVLPVEPSVSKN